MPENKRIFLTGGYGFLASHLWPELENLGFEVVCDMRYYEIENWHYVIHLAGCKNTSTQFDPRIYYDNILLSDRIFRTSSPIIYASSCVAKFNTTPYSASKLWSEHLGSIHGHSLGLRFHNLYGPNSTSGLIKYLSEKKSGEQIIIRGSELYRDYVWVEDAVKVILQNVLHPYITIRTNLSIDSPVKTIKNAGIMEVGTQMSYSTRQVVDMYTLLSGKWFDINKIDSEPHEPAAMISNNANCKTTLEEGLKLLIKQ